MTHVYQFGHNQNGTLSTDRPPGAHNASPSVPPNQYQCLAHDSDDAFLFLFPSSFLLEGGLPIFSSVSCL